MSEPTWTNVDDFLEGLNAGLFKQMVASTLSSAALGAIQYGDKKRGSKVTLEFTINRLNDNEHCDQLRIRHKVSRTICTPTGDKGENSTTESVMFVGRGGRMTEDQPTESHTGQLSLASSQKGDLI